ncbi:MAG: hypothetical protein ACRC46_13255 [Thermoguttaceae bacterium]
MRNDQQNDAAARQMAKRAERPVTGLLDVCNSSPTITPVVGGGRAAVVPVFDICASIL